MIDFLMTEGFDLDDQVIDSEARRAVPGPANEDVANMFALGVSQHVHRHVRSTRPELVSDAEDTSMP